MAFELKDYVDVAERIRIFHDKYPEGSLQSELQWVNGVFDGGSGHACGWLCKAYAYRTPDDPRPGVGHAFEPVPGKTPYTKDSEAMNAETSAWGRAIVALGFETKKIASADEVRNRQNDSSGKFAPKQTFKQPKPKVVEADIQASGEITALEAELLQLYRDAGYQDPEGAVKRKRDNAASVEAYKKVLREAIEKGKAAVAAKAAA